MSSSLTGLAAGTDPGTGWLPWGIRPDRRGHIIYAHCLQSLLSPNKGPAHNH